MSQVQQKLTIKEQLMIMFENGIDQQNAKGLINYNQTLDDCPVDAYDWQQMLIEELFDVGQYAVKENKRLKDELDETKAENLRLRQTMDHMYSTMGGPL